MKPSVVLTRIKNKKPVKVPALKHSINDDFAGFLISQQNGCL